MTKAALAVLLAAGPLAAQSLVVDRGLPVRPVAQRVELPSKEFLGDSFRIGAEGEVWMMRALRVWAEPVSGPGCGAEPGDSISKITLLGALDNPPVPGQPVCDCHALIAIAETALRPGSSAPGNPDVRITRRGALWQIDFRNVRWSVPGATDVLFTVRATPRAGSACRANVRWALAASPAGAGRRLHLLNAKGAPVGPAPPDSQPRSFAVQVWAEKTK